MSLEQLRREVGVVSALLIEYGSTVEVRARG